MAEVLSMEDIRAAGAAIGIDLSEVDLDSIRLPAGEDFGILRFLERFSVLKLINCLCFFDLYDFYLEINVWLYFVFF